MTPLVSLGAFHCMKIFSSYGLFWMDSMGTEPGTERREMNTLKSVHNPQLGRSDWASNSCEATYLTGIVGHQLVVGTRGKVAVSADIFMQATRDEVIEKQTTGTQTLCCLALWTPLGPANDYIPVDTRGKEASHHEKQKELSYLHLPKGWQEATCGHTSEPPPVIGETLAPWGLPAGAMVIYSGALNLIPHDRGMCDNGFVKNQFTQT